MPDSLRLSMVFVLWLPVLPPAGLLGGDFESTREELLDLLGGSSIDVSRALSHYNLVESAEQFSIFQRRKLHRALLKKLRSRKGEAVVKVIYRVLNQFGDRPFPSQVLLLKAMVGGRMDMGRDDRIKWFQRQIKSTSYRRQIWGFRMLGKSRWPKSIETLIGIMSREEEAGRSQESLSWHFAYLELFTALGANMVRGNSQFIRSRWQKNGRKIPRNPSYTLSGKEGAGGPTAAFFGDKISPRAVFLIDTSTSMRRKVKMGSGKQARRVAKVDIVKRELTGLLRRLDPFYEFNILNYNAKVFPWRRARPVRLYMASSSAVESAKDFTGKLVLASGTNIHDSLLKALSASEVETIYLLSDGSPSRGGDAAQIRRRVAAMNYLTGIRIVTYGFAGGGGADESLMKDLARSHYGWYRRLDE